jgi:hypothetical protein
MILTLQMVKFCLRKNVCGKRGKIKNAERKKEGRTTTRSGTKTYRISIYFPGTEKFTAGNKKKEQRNKIGGF